LILLIKIVEIDEKNSNKLAGDLHAVAQGYERDVEGKEQGCW